MAYSAANPRHFAIVKGEVFTPPSSNTPRCRCWIKDVSRNDQDREVCLVSNELIADYSTDGLDVCDSLLPGTEIEVKLSSGGKYFIERITKAAAANPHIDTPSYEPASRVQGSLFEGNRDHHRRALIKEIQREGKQITTRLESQEKRLSELADLL
jgi:hypothetical protein